MHRTQIYLPDGDYHSLCEVGKQKGLTLAELIRRAVQRYLKDENSTGLHEALLASRGCWKDRGHSAETLVRYLRKEWSHREVSGGHDDSD